jgi:hypothetical protein
MTWAIVTGMAIGAVVGGGSAALQNKDILQGALMGGVVGGVSGGIGSLGTTAATTAGEAALASSTAGELGFSAASNIAGNAGGSSLASSTAGELGFSAAGNVAGNVAGESVGAAGGSGSGALTGGEATNFMGTGALPTRMAPAFDYGAGNASSQIYADATPAQNVSSFFNTAKNYYGDNQGTIGLAGLAGGMAPNTDQPEEYDMGTIRPYTYSAGLNPGYTGAGTPYFNQRYTAGTPYAAAEGGIMRLANGGSAVSAYNKILADRAQQEYVNSPPLGAFRSHFNDPVAPPPNADTTNMLYQKYLGRDAQAVGLAAHRNATADQITYSILSSPEYLKANPGATAPKLPSNSGKINYVYNPGTGGYTTSQSDKDSEEGAAHGGLMRYAAGGVTDAPNIPTYNSGTGRYVEMPSAGVSVYDPKNPTGFDPSTGMFRTLKQQNALNPNTNNYIGSGDQDYNYVTGYTNGDSIGTQDNNTDFSQLPGYANLITPTSSEHLNTMYQGMLGRAPDESGIAAFSNMAPDQVTSAIMASAEYQAKNGPPPEPTYYYDRQPMYTPQYVHSSYPNQGYDNGNTGDGMGDDGGGTVGDGMGAGGEGGEGEGDASGGLMADKHPRYAMGGGIGSNYSGFDDHNNPTSSANFNQGPQYPMQQPQNFAYGGGISNLGGYSDGGRLLRGPGDGVSDDIPAQIGDRQPARLADGEFVVPARIVSELGNGSTDAGAKRLYAMMDRVQANRKKTVGKGKVAVNSKSNKYLPA